MKTTWEVDRYVSWETKKVACYNKKTDEIIHQQRYYNSLVRENEILAKVETELTGRWRIIHNKVSKESVFEMEVKYNYSWETIKKAHIKVVEHPKVWYTKSFFFFTTRHSSGGKTEYVDAETTTHTREEIEWVNETRFSFREVMEDSDYETTINECINEDQI